MSKAARRTTPPAGSCVGPAGRATRQQQGGSSGARQRWPHPLWRNRAPSGAPQTPAEGRFPAPDAMSAAMSAARSAARSPAAAGQRINSLRCPRPANGLGPGMQHSAAPASYPLPFPSQLPPCGQGYSKAVPLPAPLPAASFPSCPPLSPQGRNPGPQTRPCASAAPASPGSPRHPAGRRVGRRAGGQAGWAEAWAGVEGR